MTCSAARSLVWVALLASAAGAQARDLHVAQGGDDGADGGAAAPFATLQRAAYEVGPGDEVVVHAGSYAGFLIDSDPARSGTPEARVTWRPAAGDEGRVVIDRPGPENYPRGGGKNHIDLTRVHYWTLEGLVLVGSSRAGIAVLGFPDDPSVGVHVRGCELRDNRVWGIFTGFADDFVAEGNRSSGTAEQHGIYVSNTSHRPVVRGNELFDNASCGLHMNGDVSSGGEGYIFGALVEDNVIHGNGRLGGSGINCDGCKDAVIRNNLLYDTHASGVSLFAINAAGPSTGNLVVSNTILQSAQGRYAVNIQNGSTGNVVFDNLLWTDHAFRGSVAVCSECRAGFVSDFNALRPRLSLDGDATVVDLAAWRAAGYGAHSVGIESLDGVLDAGRRLVPGSPAVDAGAEALGGRVAPPRDREGTSRPQGAAFDVGAQELCPVAGCEEPGPGDDAGGDAGGDVGPDTGRDTVPDAEPGTDAAAGTDAATGSDAAPVEDNGPEPGAGSAEPARDGGCGCRAVGGSVVPVPFRRR